MGSEHGLVFGVLGKNVLGKGRWVDMFCCAVFVILVHDRGLMFQTVEAFSTLLCAGGH